MTHVDRAREVIDLEIKGLESVRKRLGDDFTRAVDRILECLRTNGKIVVTGIGKNLHVAQKVSATLASTGSTSVLLNPTQALHGDLGILCNNDVLLAISYSGESEEMTTLLPIIKRQGLEIICITGNSDSTLGRHSDITINAHVEKEACPFNMAPTVSTTAALAVGDALAMALLDARGFGKDDYAKLHPGGAIGRTLLLRVSDIMRSADRLAMVKEEAMVKDALVAMTQARAGSAGVVDQNNKLVGIFTDGDLRRHISKGEKLLDTPVADVMTSSPLTVTTDQLAVDVLRVFEQHDIDDIPVVDSAGHLVGSVDIQDLPKLKIL